MARVKTSFASAAVIIVIAVHAALLPALYFGLRYVVRNSYESMFLDRARTFGRILAEQLEQTDNSAQRISDLLDLVILNGEGAFAEYVDGSLDLRSQLNQPGLKWPGRQDFRYAENADNTYFMLLPTGRDRTAELRLGFDERPTEERILDALHRMLLTLGVYWVASLGTALLLALGLSRTVRRLRAMSRRIALGDYAQRLHLESPISELQALASDLDDMRRALVGAAERLQSEMRDRERAEAHRQELESRLRHRQRLEMLGTLAGGVAHEINNALLPIILYTESALNEPNAETARSDLQRVLASARRTREVVQKVLVFGRKLDGVKLELFDIAAVAHETVKLFVPLVPSNVTVETTISETLPAVRGDAALLQQLLLNLCINAFQALGGRAGRVSVGLRVVDAAGATAVDTGDWPASHCVELSVQDDGEGMDAATIERIFEPFFTTREVGKGTGLGLSVVHGIAESFGASIAVQSHIGTGSTFRVFFPTVVDSIEGVVSHA